MLPVVQLMTPRSTVWVPSVVTIDGTLRPVTIPPFSKPTAAPVAHAARTATGHGAPVLTTSAVTTPASPTTAPTDRSYCPATRLTETAPATIAATAVWLRITCVLSTV